MNYLLDTCVISELIKTRPSAKVVKWVQSIDESSTFISVLTIGEIYKAISKLGSSTRHVVDPAKRESEIDGSAFEFCV